MKNTNRRVLLTQMASRGREYSIALAIGILVIASCTRAGATKAHARAIKPAPQSVRPGSAAHQNSDTGSVTPKVWELTALAGRKGPSVAS